MKLIPVLLSLLLAAPAAAGSRFAPPEGKTILFVGQDVETIETYLSDFPAAPAGFMSYTSLRNLEGLDRRADPGGGVQHAKRILDKYPGMAWQLGLYLVGELENTARGRNDRNIDRLANFIRASKRPVFLRIGYEFDLPDNRYEPAAYVAAYRRIVDRFRKKGVTNVAFVWHAHAHGRKDPMMDWYPGDDYVDWVGASYFNQFHKNIAKVADLSESLGKPFMLAETSSWWIRTPAQRRSFFVKLFKFIEERNVGALCYINVNWDQQRMWKNRKWGDGRVQPYTGVMELWTSETSKDRYLKASPQLFEQLGLGAAAQPGLK